jgi:hypothetical protein
MDRERGFDHEVYERFYDTKKGFLALDDNHDGRISKEELAKRCKAWNIPLSEVDRVFAEADLDSDGKLDYREFARRYGAQYAVPTLSSARNASTNNQGKRPTPRTASKMDERGPQRADNSAHDWSRRSEGHQTKTRVQVEQRSHSQSRMSRDQPNSKGQQPRSRSHQPPGAPRLSDLEAARRVLSPGFDFGPGAAQPAAGVASGRQVVGREHMRFTPHTLHKNILKVPDDNTVWDTE